MLNRKVQPTGELKIESAEIIGSVAYAAAVPVKILIVDENGQKWIWKTTIFRSDLKYDDSLATLTLSKG